MTAYDLFAALAAVGNTATVTVEAFLYQDSSGVEHYGTPTVSTCFNDDRRRMVLDAGNGKGSQQMSTGTVYLPIGTVCPVRSRVTLADGRRTTVMQVLKHDGGGMPTPDHLECLLA